MHPLHDYAADLATALRIRLFMLRSGWVAGRDAERAQRHATLLARRLRIAHTAGARMAASNLRSTLHVGTMRGPVPGARARAAAQPR